MNKIEDYHYSQGRRYLHVPVNVIACKTCYYQHKFNNCTFILRDFQKMCQVICCRFVACGKGLNLLADGIQQKEKINNYIDILKKKDFHEMVSKLPSLDLYVVKP